jgi:hypothetical protein
MVPETEIAFKRLVEMTARTNGRLGADAARQRVAEIATLGRSYTALVNRQYGAAAAAVREYMKIIDVVAKPELSQGAHGALGLIALDQKKYDVAVREMSQTSQEDMFNVYYLAVAQEGAGNRAEAEKSYRRVAGWYFNTPTIGILRKEALKKLGAVS